MADQELGNVSEFVALRDSVVGNSSSKRFAAPCRPESGGGADLSWWLRHLRRDPSARPNARTSPASEGASTRAATRIRPVARPGSEPPRHLRVVPGELPRELGVPSRARGSLGAWGAWSDGHADPW